MKSIFEKQFLENFWDEDYKSYTGSAITDDQIQEAEKELKHKLPDSYIELLKNKNGGVPKNTRFPTKKKTSWAKDHVAISAIHGINDHDFSLLGDIGSQFMKDEWGYPDIGIVICDTPSAGHDAIMLDYRKCGKNGEPKVVHVDVDSYKPKITHLADSFEAFVKGLVNESVYAPPAGEELAIALEKVTNGRFSIILRNAFEKVHAILPDAEIKLRQLLIKLVKIKDGFYIHDDDLSTLVRDYLFWLFTQINTAESLEQYINNSNIEDAFTLHPCYQYMIHFVHETDPHEIETGGYCVDFVKDWWKDRVEKNMLIKTTNGYMFSENAVKDLMNELGKIEV